LMAFFFPAPLQRVFRNTGLENGETKGFFEFSLFVQILARARGAVDLEATQRAGAWEVVIL
jgi:hypothetical protein